MLSQVKNKLPFKLTQFSTRALLKHKVHIGSNLTNLNSTFFRYGFFNWELTKRSVQIRLKYSLYYLKTAINVVSSVVHNQGTILIIQDHAAMSSTFINLLKQTGQPMALRPWLPGTLSNFRVLRQTYLKVFYLKRELTKHFAVLYEKLNITANTKKYVQSKININKLAKELVKYVDSLASLPHLVIFGNSLQSHLAVNESRLMGIPSIGLIDSNASVFAVNYFIPWNNKSTESLSLFFQIVALTILKGQLLVRQTFLFKTAHKSQVRLKKAELAAKTPQGATQIRLFNPKEAIRMSTVFLKHVLNSVSLCTPLAVAYLNNSLVFFFALLKLQLFLEPTHHQARKQLLYNMLWGGSSLKFGVQNETFVQSLASLQKSGKAHKSFAENRRLFTNSLVKLHSKLVEVLNMRTSLGIQLMAKSLLAINTEDSKVSVQLKAASPLVSGQLSAKAVPITPTIVWFKIYKQAPGFIRFSKV